MQVVSFLNMKGGVAKTTLAVNVAYGLALRHKKKVLIVDGDPQFNATQYLLDDDAYLEHINDQSKGTIRDIFVPTRPGPVNTVSGISKPINKKKMPLSACTISVFEGGKGQGTLDLLPSTLQLIDVETSARGTEFKLKSYLQEKAAGYDYVIIDCPPTISIFTLAAILASNKYLVPLKPDPLSLIGLPLLERWLDEFVDENALDIQSVGMVFTMVRGPQPAAMKNLMADLRKSRRNQIFTNYLSTSTHVASSVEAHQPVFLHRRNSKTALQINAITDEFLNRTSHVTRKPK